jgi:hypothetical protein
LISPYFNCLVHAKSHIHPTPLTTTPSSWKHIACNSKLLSIPRRSFMIPFLECQDQWMMLRFFRFHFCTKRPWMGNCFISIVVWMMLNLIWLETKLTLCFHSRSLPLPYKQLANSHHTIWKALYNKQLCQARSVVENSFGILKKSFRKLLLKSHLNILFLHYVVVCCCILYNMILDGKDQDIENLMTQLDLEKDANNVIICRRKKTYA